MWSVGDYDVMCFVCLLQCDGNKVIRMSSVGDYDVMCYVCLLQCDGNR